MQRSSENQRPLRNKTRALVQRARQFRKNPTPAEDILWQILRRKKLKGLQFRRQHPVAGVIVDFFCAKARLVVEIDGPIHERQRERDSARTRLLESGNYRVVRFTNHDVLERTNEVVKQIIKECGERL